MGIQQKGSLFYANTKKQLLSEHLQAVSKNAVLNASRLYLTDPKAQQTIINAAETGGLLHDVGKVLEFQDYIRIKIEGRSDYLPELAEDDEFAEEVPLHNELSLLFINLNPPEITDRATRLAVEFAIYWHHAKYQGEKSRYDLLLSYCDGRGVSLLDAFSQVAASIGIAFPTIDSEQLLDSAYRIKFPDFYNVPLIRKSDDLTKVSRHIVTDAINHLCRYAVVKADRYVSSLEPRQIHQIEEPISVSRQSLSDAIAEYAEEFPGERSDKQMATAKMVAEYDKNVVLAGAGSGKTRISLLSYNELQLDCGLIYIVPRVEVALSLLNELEQHLSTVKIHILTGQHRYTLFQHKKVECEISEADIVITTIDQLAASIARVSPLFTEYLQRYCVFDEYHEIFKIRSLNYIALVAMKMKAFKKNSSLYISATMDAPALRLVLDNAAVNRPARMVSFNQRPVVIQFSNMRDYSSKNALYIFNTAKAAQEAALEEFNNNNDILCYHSRFRAADKIKLASRVLSEFGRNALHTPATLYAGPIAQASLNISRSNLFTEASTPENFIQRIGRCNRFEEYESANVVLYTDAIKSKKVKSGLKIITNNKKSYGASYYYERSSYDFFQQLAGGDIKNTQKLTTTIDELTDLYFQFCNTNRLFFEDTVEFYRDSFNYFKDQHHYEPMRSFSKAKGTRRVSFRGESYMAVTQIVTNGTQTGWTTENLSDTDNFISVENYVVRDIGLDISANLVLALDFDQLLEWSEKTANIKYRAQHMGYQSINEYLAFLAKCGVPAVLSVLGQPNKDYSYIINTSPSHELIIGLMKNKNTHR